MLKQSYQFCLRQIAVAERDLFRASRRAADSDVAGSKTAREAARVFAYLTAGIKFIFLQFLLVFIELAILIVLSPKDGYELFLGSWASKEAQLPFSLSSSRFFLSSPRFSLSSPRRRGSSLDSRLHGNDNTRTYEAYEKKHKKARWVSLVSFSATVAAVVAVSLVVNLILPLAPSVLGATYTWSQTNWGGGATANNAIHPTNQSAWSQYSSNSSEITVVNGGEDLELVPHSASTTQTTNADFNAGTKGQNISVSGSGNSASVVLNTAATSTSDADFNAGTYSTTTVSGSGSSASVKLSKALHINEYTIGSLATLTGVTASVSGTGPWVISASTNVNLSRIFKNDKFTDAVGRAWKIISVSDSANKIIVVDSEGNNTAPTAGANSSVGRWYASISAWEAGRNANITATGRNAIERGLPYYDGAADTNLVTIDGWTTDATHYVEIFVPLSERHRGKWDNNKYRLERSSTSISISEEYVRIDGLQIKGTLTGTQSGTPLVQGSFNNASSDIRISNNIFQADFTGVTSGYAYGIAQWWNAAINWKIWNNVFYNFSGGGSGSGTSAIYINDGGVAYVYNNTIVNSRVGISKASTATVVAKNNIVQGSVDGFLNIGGTSDYNISDLASDAPGANSKNSTTVPFVDPSAGDFHLDFRDGTGNPAMNAGVNVMADANLPFNTDIDGDTRSGTWDIGADDVGATLVMPHSIGTASRDFSTLQAWEDARDGTTTSRQVFRATQQSAFTEGETVTGATSGATGAYIKAEATPKSSLKGNYNTPGNARDLYVSGNYAYVTDGASGLQIINISNPATPTLAGTYNTPGDAVGVFVSGNYAYVADYGSGLQIINISNPATPTLAGTYATPYFAYDVFVSGNYAYVADGSSGLLIINISNPAAPTLAGTYTAVNAVWDVYVSGNYAYLADYNSNTDLQIIDISNPASPTFAGTYNISGGSAREVYISGNYAYVAAEAAGLEIINISSSTAPTLAGIYNTPGSAIGVFVSGNYAYVADNTSGLQIINISNPAAPTLAGNYPFAAAGSVYVSGGYAYVSDDTAGIQIIKPLEYFSLDSVSGTFQAGETVTGGTSGATSTIGAILTTAGTIEKGEAYKDSTFTAGVTIDGSTTDANHYMWLTAEPGSRHTGVAGTGAKISAGSTNIVELGDNYDIFENFEVNHSVSNSTVGISFLSSGITNGIARNNLVYRSVGTGGTGIHIGYTLPNYIYNNIVFGFSSSIGILGDNSSLIYNNVSYGNSYGLNFYGTSGVSRNNIAAGSGIDFNGSVGASSSNNISSDATAPGTGSLTNKSVSDLRFVSTASDFIDLHIMDGSVAKDAGADLSATFNTDVDGQTRPNGSAFDAGADEWFSSSPVYNTSGTFTSGTIDFGNPVNFDSLMWNPTSTQPVSGSLKFAVAAKSADSSWQDSDFIDLNQEAYPSGVTVHTSYIRPSGQCTGYNPCYNTLFAWEAAQNRDIVASNEVEVAQIGGSWTSPDTTSVTIGGWTTDATHYIRVYTAPEARHNGKWDNTKYRLIVSSSVALTMADSVVNHIKIDGLQIEHLVTNNGWDETIELRGGDGSNISISNNILKGTISSSPVNPVIGIWLYWYGSGTRTAKIWNNIIYNYTSSTGSGTAIYDAGGWVLAYLYNNTVYNSNVGFRFSGGIMKNNIAYNNTDNYAINTGSTVSSSNNLSGPGLDPDTPSAGARNGVAVSFVDASGSDFRLASSDTGAKNYGTSSVSEIGFATDIEGHLRSTGGASWDIGAHEYGATGGNVASSLDGNRYLRYKAYLSTADSAFSPQLDDLAVHFTGQDTFTSGTIDFGSAVKFDSLTWNPTSTQPVSTGLQMQVAAKNTDSGWADSDFVDLNQEPYPDGVTVHTSYIRPSGQCTGYSPCYNTLFAWEAAQNRNLVVAANAVEIAQIGGSWTSPDTTAVIIDGWTTDATHYIKIYTTPEARHNGKWDTGKYRLELSNQWSPVLNIAEDYVRVDGLQIQNTRTDSQPGGLKMENFASTGGEFIISNNIIKFPSSFSSGYQTGIATSVGGSYINSNSIVKIYNNIIYDAYNGIGGGTAGTTQAATHYIYNNTIVNSKGYGISFGFNGPLNSSAALKIKNNLIQGSYANFNVYGTNLVGLYETSNNLSQDATSPDTAYRSKTVSFTDSANNDYHLASSDAGAKNSGTSSVSEIGFATDIEGHLRSTGGASWDIGASEYGATGGAVPASFSGNRYLRYKAYFSTADSAFSPQLDDVTVNYTYYATSSPTLISSPYNSNDATNILGKIAWTATTTSGTEARVQVRSAPNSGGVPGTWSQWCGYTTCDDVDYFASSTNGVDLASGHPLKNGNNDQWLQYKVILVSTGASTPTFGGITMTYVVNAPPVLQNVTASQQTSDGKVAIAYEVKDVDTATGTVTPNAITPSFSYSTDGGSNWTAIASGYLSADTLTNKTVNGSTFTQYATLWDAKSQINGTYATNTKIMVSATDNEGANNTASLASSVFSLDVKNPVATVVVDGTKDGQAGAITTSVTENSSAQMMLSNLSNYSADGLNGSSGTWIATSTSLVWTFASGDPVRVYAKVKDAYQNEVTVAPDAPNMPTTVTIQDISNLNLSEFREFISWNVSTSSDFASYKIYRSTDGSSYSLLSTIASVAVNYLEDGSSGAWLSNGTMYYYKLTASDAAGNISRYSSAVSDIPDGQGGTDVTPPTISGLASSNLLPTQATITWTTDELSNSTVYYSVNSSYSSSKAVASMVTAHSVTLTGLTPGTTYNFRARSTDPLSNVSSYATGTPFATTQGPIISGVVVVSASGNSAEIVWNTNANSDSWVIYSLSSDLSGSQTVGTSTLVGGAGPNYEHRVALSSLNTNAKYYFKVRSVDGSSNSAEDNNGGAYYTFSTAQDVSPPIISNVVAALASQTSAAISWTTNELADSQVIYGLDQSSLTSQTAVNSTMTINHSMVLNGLTAGAKYYYKVVSADSSANSTQSAVYDFSTTAQELIKVTQYVESQPADKTTPIISDVSFSDIGETAAAVSWGTDENSGSFVEFGTTEQLGTTIGQFESAKIHRVELKWLSQNTLYYLRSKSPDESGNLGVSKIVSFKTLPAKTAVDQVADIAKNIAKSPDNQKSIEQLTKEVEQMLIDLATKVAPPRITGAEPQVEITSSFATISWITDRPANSMIAFAGERDYLPNSDDPYQISVGDADEQVTEHRVVLSDLAPGTLYHFQVRSKGIVGGVGASKDFTFRTGEEASISGVEIKEIKKDSATILWRTNIPASSLLEYGLSTAYGSKQSDDAFNVSHIAILRNLNSGTFYHFKIGGTDKNSNAVASPDLTFTTESLPSLLNVKIDAVKEKEIKISWYTDVLADSTAEYTNLKTNRTETFGDKQLVRNHALAVTGLDEDAPYKLNVISKDDKGNEVKSSTYNFQTTRDREAPQITNIQTQSAVSGKDRVQTIVSWKTSEPASSRVIYQEGVVKKSELEKTSPLDNDLKLNHIVVFTDFRPGAVYRLKIESVDGSNNAGESRDLTILTPQRKETVVDLIIKNFQDVFRWTEKMR